MNLIEVTKKDNTTKEMEYIAREENVSPEYIRDGIKNGSVVILRNRKHNIGKYCAVGKGLRTKTNANIGVFIDKKDFTPQRLDEAIKYELEKLRVAIGCGVDTVMDLSNGEGIGEIRQAMLHESTVPLGTVPLYEIARNVVNNGGSIPDITLDNILKVIAAQAKEGVSYMTLHCAILKDGVKLAQNRIGGIVSRGGHMMDVWMQQNDQENPLYTYFDEILAILKQYDVTLSIGDGLRPGATVDASDAAQMHELRVGAELVEQARGYGVQVIVEGPGHVPLDKIEETMKQEKEVCHGAPFYVLGPLVIDNGAGYDHIVGGIGAALAAKDGAKFLCYVTPSEHLHLPKVDDVRRGAIAIVKAAEAADKGLDNDGILETLYEIEDENVVSNIWKEAELLSTGDREIVERNNTLSQLRRERIWSKQADPKYALFPEAIRKAIREYGLKDGEPCNMCGDQCAVSKER